MQSRRVKMEKEQLKHDYAEMEQKQLKHDHVRARKRKQRDSASEESKTKEKESDRLRKKFSEGQDMLTTMALGDVHDTSLTSNSYRERFAIQHLISHGYNRYLLAYLRIFFCTRHTLRMHTPS